MLSIMLFCLIDLLWHSPWTAGARVIWLVLGTIGVCVAAFILVVIGYRRSNAKTSQPVGVGFMQVSDTKFLTKELAPGVPITINVAVKNAGAAPVEDVYTSFSASLVPVGPNPDNTDQETHVLLLKAAHKGQQQIVNDGRKGSTVGVGHGVWTTLELPQPGSPPLTNQQITEIMQGKTRLYVYVWARWRDEPHDYELCRWLEPPLTTKISNDALIWHLCAE